MKSVTLMLALMVCGNPMAAIGGTEAPTLIPFQGRLTDQHGNAYSNAQYGITFCIYRDPAGGAPDWTERHEKVGIINGMINVFLGSITPLPDGMYFSRTAYLGITIDSDGNNNTPDPEMVPRQLIVTPFFAKNADKLRGADWSAIMVADEADDPMTGHVNGAKLADKSVTKEKLADNVFEKGFEMPAGVIMPFAGPKDKIPTGWWLCNGQVLNKAEHPLLYAAIGDSWPNVNNIPFDSATQFCLPDFTSRTLWGAADGDSTSTIGKYLEAGLPNITGKTAWSQADYGQRGIGYEGAFYKAETRTGGTDGYDDWDTCVRTYFDASKSSSVYGRSKTVQPPAGCVYFIIKD